jgi:hypothetical protein
MSQIRDPDFQVEQLLGRCNLILSSPRAHYYDVFVDESSAVYNHEPAIQVLHLVGNNDSKQEHEGIRGLSVIEYPIIVANRMQGGVFDKVHCEVGSALHKYGLYISILDDLEELQVPYLLL